MPNTPNMSNMVHTPHVLIVDDDLLLRRIIAMNLVQHGSSVVEAASVECAHQLLLSAWEAGRPFDLIILETHLSDQSGWDLLRLLRSPEVAQSGLPAPRIVAMSALPIGQSRVASGVPYAPLVILRKPFTIEALLAATGLRHSAEAGRQSQHTGVSSSPRRGALRGMTLPTRPIEESSGWSQGERVAIERPRRDLRDQQKQDQQE